MISRADRIRSALLALRFRRGDRAAFEDLAAVWEKPLFYYIRRLTRSEEDAWDVSQNLWVCVFRKLGQLRDPDSLAPWLYRIARNTAFNHFHANPDWDALSGVDVDAIEDERTPSAKFSSADAEAIHHALDQLPVPQREALTLFFLEEFTLQEISAITGAAVGTVKSRLYYGKRALREIIQREASHNREDFGIASLPATSTPHSKDAGKEAKGGDLP
ncbi:MAG: sigma-70 family RNA polymerase sigma factor [Candidatus Hydrogenedentes bacterium]|nr:sigma-70 family RNA polymerase sigma factor [Candidatus Hydrogenedentota bacterium]